MKKVLSFATCLALGLSVVGTTAALADSGKFYFDNDAAGWAAVNVWAWVSDDDMWALDNGFEAWPGIALEKDAETGYYVYECADVVDGMAVMFNDNGAGQQTNDTAATAAVAGKVCVVTEADENGQMNATWNDVAAAGTTEETTTEETTTEETTTEETTTEETTADAGKTADVAPIAAVAMLGLASMAVVVATRKKIA